MPLREESPATSRGARPWPDLSGLTIRASLGVRPVSNADTASWSFGCPFTALKRIDCCLNTGWCGLKN